MTPPKLVITDIDGVWTDGGMYYGQNNLELKKFNTSDSVGVLFLRYMKIPLVIMTGENSDEVRRRAKKLKVQEVYLGVSNKLELAQKICAENNLDLKDIAFVGDDINDMELLTKVGFSASPQNAPWYVKEKVHLVLETKGGDGAFREFVEFLVSKYSSFDFVLSKYFEEKKLNQ